MSKLVLRRFLQAIPTFLGITLISFIIVSAAPGDPVSLLRLNPNTSKEANDALYRQLGLDQPIPLRYLYWLVGNDYTQVDTNDDGVDDAPGVRQGILRGDLGISVEYKRPVLDLIAERIPATLLLTFTALVVGYVVGIAVGLYAASQRQGWLDQLMRFASAIGIALPSFWLALILIIVFGVRLHLLPTGGMRDVTQAETGFNLFATIPYMILPVCVLAITIIARVSRFVRASVLETYGEDYVRTAYAKGLPERVLWSKHVLRNALLPVASMLGPELGRLLNGAVIIEQVFNWPGLGRLAIDGAFQRDYPLVMGFVVVGSLMYLGGVILTDLLYMFIDPRIRLRT